QLLVEFFVEVAADGIDGGRARFLVEFDGHRSLPVRRSTMRAVPESPSTMASPMEIGRVKRLGPALPGLTNSTPPWRASMRGRCEWPDTTMRAADGGGSVRSCARSCSA